jgi:putative transposase
MSRNYYSEINLHIVWHTKLSQPLLAPELESAVHQFLKDRIIHEPGAFIHEIGGTATHVHLCVSTPPTLTISNFIGELKGSSSHHANHTNPTRDTVLQWQVGYGVVSFGTGDLEWVKGYVRNQKEHHRVHRDHDRLERITHEDA